ncbi:MAG: L,D-transpeptidase [Hyphomicrobiales bacterium]
MFARVVIAVSLFFLALLPARAETEVVVRIDLSDQLMTVYVDNVLTHEWPVSTARRGYRTPVGTYKPIRLERYWRSRKYDNAPMPFSVFFHGGYAIHGTTAIRQLGRPASHGCVRLHPDNAKVLFETIAARGKAATVISVVR